MSGVSGISSSGNVPPIQPEPTGSDPNESSAVNFFQSQFASQLAAVGKETTL